MTTGWETVRLADVVSARSGDSKVIKGKQSTVPGPGLYQGFSASGPDVWVDRWVVEGPGVVVSAVGARCGKTFLADGRWIAIANTHVLVPGPDVDVRWLWYLTNNEDFWEKGGSAQPFVKVRSTLDRSLSLPPLEEQKRIVAILDAAFTDIDAVTHKLGQCELKARQVFASWLRQTFDQATEGRVPLEDPRPVSETDGLSPAAETAIASTVRRTRTGGRDATTRAIPGELSLSVGFANMPTRDGWKWSNLSELATLESGHTPSRRNPDYWSGTIPWIGIQDAKKAHGGWISDTTQKVTEAGVNNSSTRVLPSGTVCLSRTASVGYVVIMGQDMATSQDFANWICGPNLDPEFLQFALLAEGRDLLKFASGAVHQTIYYPELKALRICHPSIERQRALVSELKQVRAESEDMHRSFESKLGLAVDLRQSLLHQAFRGQL